MASKKGDSKNKLLKDKRSTSGSQSILKMFQRQSAMNQLCDELSMKEASSTVVKSDYFDEKVTHTKSVQRRAGLSLGVKQKCDESNKPVIIDGSDTDEGIESEQNHGCQGKVATEKMDVQIFSGSEDSKEENNVNSKEKGRRLSLRKRKGSDSILPGRKKRKSVGKTSSHVATDLCNEGSEVGIMTELGTDGAEHKKCNSEEIAKARNNSSDFQMECNDINLRNDPKKNADNAGSVDTCGNSGFHKITSETNEKSALDSVTVSKVENEKPSTPSIKSASVFSNPRPDCEATSEETLGEGNPSVENGDVTEDAGEEGGEFRVPYYLENFHLVMRTVLEDEFCVHLFNDEDMATVDTFRELSDSGQKLYIRLFQRKHKWLRQAKIVYPQIEVDLTSVLRELCSCHLLDDESCLTDLEDVLEVLPVPELRSLAKSLRLNQAAHHKDVIAAIVKHAKGQHLSAFFKQSQGGTSQVILKRGKSLLGTCFRLSRAPRAVFIRLMMLFGLHETNGDEEEAGGGHQQLFQILMANIGQIKYPEYTILKKTPVFSSRQDLLRFECSIQTEIDMMTAMEKHHFDEALWIYGAAREVYENLWKDDDYIRHAKSLPLHLRSFTASSVYIRVMTYGVEALQRRRRYPEAVALLEDMLSQDVFQLSYHGRWYERLALNLDQHLKQPLKALDKIETALQDPFVRTGGRMSLFQRAQRLCTAPAHKKLHQHWHKFEHDPMALVQEPVKVTIKCRQVSQAGLNALGVCRFITDESLRDGNMETTFFRSVEDVVLAHYKDNGYPKGVHGEGRTYLFLFHLFFWDVVFMGGIPDVFLNAYQTHPLDVRMGDFYPNRKEAFDRRHQEIKSMSTEALLKHVADMWEKYEGFSCAGCNWTLFDDVEHCQGLVECLGANHLAGILERMMKDLRNTTGGGPDLIVWNRETGRVKISEVKGPGDRLSTKQILWLDYLTKLGMDAEVCHVEAIGVKKLR